MGTSALDCTVVRANVMTSGMFGAGLTPLPPAGTVPPPPPLGIVTAEVNEETDLVDFSILSVFALGSWIKFLVLIRITSKILSVGTSCSNFPC